MNKNLLSLYLTITFLALGLLAVVIFGSLRHTISTIKSFTFSNISIQTEAEQTPDAYQFTTISTYGGLCVDGPCTNNVILWSNGYYTYKNNTESRDGFVDNTLMNKALTEFRETNIATIPQQPVGFTCPIVYDGVEFIFTFSQTGEAVRTCSQNIDGVVLFKTLGMLYSEAVAGL